MRIRRVRIDSFGALRGRTMDFDRGMTVVYGPNESGKTTTMEFIRSATVPPKGRNLYPERDKSDSGSMEYEEDGEVRTVFYKNKKLSGDVPKMPNGADDPDMYRSVFAMNSSDLNDDKVVERLRSRFLTVPGGERMPSAMVSCESVTDDILGKATRSRSKVNAVGQQIEDLDRRIAEAKGSVDRYGELQSILAELERQSSEIRKESEATSGDRRTYELYQSMQGSYERLGSCEKELSDLGDFRRVTSEDEGTLSKLNESVSLAQGEYNSIEESFRHKTAGMKGADPEKVARDSSRIRQLLKDESAYNLRMKNISEAKPVEPQEQQVRREVRKTNPLVYLGLVLIAAGVAGLIASPYILALSVAGAVAAVWGFRNPKVEVTYETVPQTFQPVVRKSEDDVRFVADYENDVTSLMSDLCLMHRSISSDLALLGEIIVAYDSLQDLQNNLLRAKADLSDAKIKLQTFYSGFGGQDGYSDCKVRTSKEAELKGRIDTLRRTIESAGLNPDIRESPVAPVEDSSAMQLESLGKQKGQIVQQMSSILNDKDIERLMDTRSQLNSELQSYLTEGAVSLLASSIAEDACIMIQSEMQPGVTASAGRYLSMMTDGRYVIDLTPADNTLRVVGDGISKSATQWSTGLRAQALLSVKLAIAREMGGGRVPVILDDVLTVFDSERKAGACRALNEVSDEMQVILFTCDRETADICRGIDGIEVLDI